MQLEPHPVSGELELFSTDDEDDGRVFYRRVDAETLHARCNIPILGIACCWVWCVNDTGVVGMEVATGGEAKDGWMVAEVLPLEDEDGQSTFDPDEWYPTLQEAEESAESRGLSGDGFHDGIAPSMPSQHNTIGVSQPPRTSAGDDDDYWASYDQTPSRTPARTPGKRSPAPGSFSAAQQYRDRQMSTYSVTSEAEADYYARYGNEVQPAMDNHDPEEAAAAAGAGIDVSEPAPQRVEHEQNAIAAAVGQSRLLPVADDGHYANQKAISTLHIHSPQPSTSPSAHSSHSSDDVANLEAAATSQSWMSGVSESSTSAEAGIKRHIGMEIKSLFRLAQGTGIERREFERMVKTELELLGLVEL